MSGFQDLTVGQLLALAGAMLSGNFTVEKGAPNVGTFDHEDDVCDGHGGIDWCSGSICACNDGHVFIRN